MTTSGCPKSSIILVTGGTGFVASQVIETLLRAPDGLFVRFTSRSTSRIEKSTEHFSQKFGSHRICGLLVEHPELPGAYDEAVEGVSGIIDLACPTQFSELSLNQLVSLASKQVESLLASALQEPSIKRVIHTSAELAAGDGNVACFQQVIDGTIRPVYLNQKSWNKKADVWRKESHHEDCGMELDGESARSSPETEGSKGQRFAMTFGIMKCEAERSALKFVEKNKPQFLFTSVLPAFVFGPPSPASNSISTSGWLLALGNNCSQVSRPNFWSVPLQQVGCPIQSGSPPQSFVDINDLSLLLHTLLVTPSLEPNERILASTSSFSWNDILKIIHQVQPKSSLPKYLEGNEDQVDHTVIDNGRFLELLEFKGGNATCLHASIRDTLRS